jgi:uncharacterized protein
MSASAAIASANIDTHAVAAWWHTVVVVAPIVIGSIASAYQHGLRNAHLPGVSSRLSGYITVLAIEWVPVLLIWLALRRRALPMATLVSGRWQTPSAFLRDLGVAAGFWVIAVPLGGVIAYVLGGKSLEPTMAKVVPKTPLELGVFLTLAVSAGFCEEVVFRGYLTRQFSSWTGSHRAAIALQGVAFGLAHGYYRWAMVAPMALGWLLGLVAYWRKSLRPGMLAHGLQDAIGGVVAFLS